MMDRLQVHPVIMAGGMGTRLWPVSRQSRPKQFQPIVSDYTMLQETARRVTGQVGAIAFAPPSVIGGRDFGALIKEDLSALTIDPAKIILEPFGRNTAAVAAIAALAQEDPDALVLLLPSDHHMTDPDGFRQAVAEAAPIAADGFITTFGIEARSPHTGYGYIRQGAVMSGRVLAFDAFVEKPDRETAEAYLQDGNYSWNAGIFLFSAKAMLAELDAYAPDIVAACRTTYTRSNTSQTMFVLDADSFANVRSDSIDYAVMEQTKRGAVLAPLRCGWDDIGSWNAVAALSDETTEDGQVLRIDTHDCHIRSDGETFVAAIGVQDLIIRVQDGAVLVAHKDHTQQVKAVVEHLKTSEKSRYL